MSITLSEFWTRLVQAGLADAEGCRKLAKEYSRAAGGPPADSESLAKFLLRHGRISRFQAEALFADSPPRLRFGPFVRTGRHSPVPLSQWFPAKHTQSGKAGHVRVLGQGALDDELVSRLKAHAKVAARTLQPIRFAPLANEGGIVFTLIPPGRTLSERLATSSASDVPDPLRVGTAVAEALAALHVAGLRHGEVAADRVWLCDDGGVLLLRDPSRSAVGRTAPDEGWLDVDPQARGELGPAAAGITETGDTPADDCFHLGCLLYRIDTGRPPFPDKPFPDTTTAPARDGMFWESTKSSDPGNDELQVPAELAEAIRQGSKGNPLHRVLAHCLSGNREARFRDAGQVAKALQRSRRATRETVRQPSASPTRSPSQTRPFSSETVTSSGKAPPPNDTQPPNDAPPAAAASLLPGEPRNVPGPAAPSDARPALDDSIAPTSKKSRSSKFPASTSPASVSAAETSSASDPSTSRSGSPGSAPGPSPRPASSPRRESSRPRSRRRKPSAAPYILGGLGVTALVMLVAVLVARPSSGPDRSGPSPRQRPPAVTSPDRTASTDTREPDASPDASEAGGRDSGSPSDYELVADQRLLWAPPFPPQPAPPRELLPPGPGILATVRLARWVETPAGRRLIEAFTPELPELIESVQRRTGVDAASIRRLSVALHPGHSGWPEVSLAIELEQPRPLDELLDRWKAGQARTPDGQTIYVGEEPDDDAFFVRLSRSDGNGTGDVNGDVDENVDRNDSDGEQVVAFAVGSTERMSEVAEFDGGPIPLPQSLDRLWRRASADADFVALCTPNFLFADARALMEQTAPDLEGPLRQMLIPDASGWLIAAALTDDALYAETRLLSSGTVGEAELLNRLRDAVERWPQWGESFLLRSVADPSWRLLATRLPSMLRFVGDHARFDVADGAAVANVYLPADGAAQLGLATLLAANTPASSGTDRSAPAPDPLTLDEMLQRKMSVRFDQESLEFAVQTILEEFARSLPRGTEPPRVEIRGGELEKMGITQNQQVRDFDRSEIPLRQVLTDLVLGANPDRTATGPADPKQSLVWIVADDADGQPMIQITTRQAATDREVELPQEFRESP